MSASIVKKAAAELPHNHPACQEVRSAIATLRKYGGAVLITDKSDPVKRIWIQDAKVDVYDDVAIILANQTGK